MIDASTEKKYCAGIVTYNPDLQKLDKNIINIIDQVEVVLICDNGSKNLENIRGYIEKYTKVQLLAFTENKGIAAALNCLAKESSAQGYEWILTLDQDSVCPPNLISTFEKYVSDDVAILSPQIVYRNNEQYSEIPDANIEEVQWVITSASFTNLEVWKKLGGFDEKLFIDKVDYDFCIRAGNEGFKILRINDVTLMHELGNLKCRKVLGRTIYVTNHSPLRKYYMVRNSIYLDKKHGEKRRFSCIAKNVIKTLLYEDQKTSKLKSICKGIRDGRKM